MNWTWSVLGVLLLGSVGCTQIPEWETAERKAAETALQEAVTQVDMNGATGGLVEVARERMLAALNYQLNRRPREEWPELLRDQDCWLRWVEKRNQAFITDGSIAPTLQNLREEARLRNRFLELTVPDEVERVFRELRSAPLRFQGKETVLQHGELDLWIPLDKLQEGASEFETVGQLQVPFCREFRLGEEVYRIGVVEPTNYEVVSSFGVGTESNLCVWKNGENIANHLIGKEITLQELTLERGWAVVLFQDREGKLRRREFDCLNANGNSVEINHWTTEKIE